MALRLSISSVLHSLLPRSCLLCGAAASECRALCAACQDDLPHQQTPVCPCCALPLALAATACGVCLQHPPAFDATQAALPYTFPVDRLILGLKFGHRLAIADFLAQSMLTGEHPAGDVLVPVPLSRRRLAERGFNQALEIARRLARTCQLPIDFSTLSRVRETPPQSRLPWRVRKQNVRHAFECHRDFSGRTVILVDDVMTTGATLDAAARCLKDHGAARVVNWVAARALRTPDLAT